MHLHSLDVYRLVDVIKKMTPVSFCRMQQTSRYFLNLVTENSQMMGVRISKLQVSQPEEPVSENFFHLSRIADDDLRAMRLSGKFTLMDQMRGIFFEELEVKHVPSEALQAEINSLFSTQGGEWTLNWIAENLPYNLDSVADMHSLVLNCKPFHLTGKWFYARLKNFIQSQRFLLNVTGRQNKKPKGFWKYWVHIPRVELKWDMFEQLTSVKTILQRIPGDWADGGDVGVCQLFSIFIKDSQKVGWNFMHEEILESLTANLECESQIIAYSQSFNVDIHRISSENGKEAALILSKNEVRKLKFPQELENWEGIYSETIKDIFYAFVPVFDDWQKFVKVSRQ